MNLGKEINIVELLTLLVLIGGGVFSWSALDRYQAKESKANTNLISLQTKIEELQLSVLELEKTLEINSKRVNTSYDLSKLLKDIRSNVSVKIDDKFEQKDGVYRITFSVSNNGAHPVKITNITFKLSEFDLSSDEERRLLGQSSDYDFYAYPLTQVMANQKVKHNVNVRFKKDVKKTLFYEMKYSYTLVPEIKKIVTKVLLDTTELSEKDLENIYTYSYSTNGYLNF